MICADRYGNLLSNVDEALAQSSAAREVHVGGRRVPWRRTYSDAAPGELLALINSFGVLEIARRDGNAEQHLGLTRGALVELSAPAPGR